MNISQNEDIVSNDISQNKMNTTCRSLNVNLEFYAQIFKHFTFSDFLYYHNLIYRENMIGYNSKDMVLSYEKYLESTLYVSHYNEQFFCFLSFF